MISGVKKVGRQQSTRSLETCSASAGCSHSLDHSNQREGRLRMATLQSIRKQNASPSAARILPTSQDGHQQRCEGNQCFKTGLAA